HDEGMRDAVCQDRDRCDHAGQGQPEGCAAPSGCGRELAAQEVDEFGRRHWLTRVSEPCTVATAEAPMRNESSGSSILIRTGTGAGSGTRWGERATGGSPLPLFPFSGRTAKPSPTAVPRKGRPEWDWR